MYHTSFLPLRTAGRTLHLCVIAHVLAKTQGSIRILSFVSADVHFQCILFRLFNRAIVVQLTVVRYCVFLFFYVCYVHFFRHHRHVYETSTYGTRDKGTGKSPHVGHG